MGIPSYYKKLSDKIKGLIIKHKPSNINGVYFDFNCMIYHCARRPNSTLPPYPGDDGKIEWENLLIDDIVRYIVKIWHELQQPKEVFLAIDGVVPMAKIKQQRLRRFKSVWLSEEEKKAGIRDNTPTWDTNCITPGTAFMNRLNVRLHDLCTKRPGWRVSGANESGEGEHKIMNLLRKKPADSPENDSESIVIYGLDADLILLTLLNANKNAYLMREDSEMGMLNVNGLGEETYSYFSIDVLKNTIWTEKEPTQQDICEYICAMSLLGNDFLPHSLSVKIKEDGHGFLLKGLAELHHYNMSLIENVDSKWKLNEGSLLFLLKRWAKVEETRMLHTFRKKLQLRGRSEINLENQPIQWAVEQPLIRVEEGEWSIKPEWQNHYRSEWLQCQDKDDIVKCCREYIFGLQWILDYYTGQASISKYWSYPRLLPPLWCDIVDYMELGIHTEQQKKEAVVEKDILPEEQLAMVLPLESWHLLENKSLRILPSLYPHFWPKYFGFFSAGRTRMWECEPCIPMFPIEKVRGEMS